MMTFSANLGLLFTEYDLPDAIRAAKAAGFDAVECHWPYPTPADALKMALNETGLPILGLNTPRGDADQGEFGLSALPGREAEAQAAINMAVTYAQAIGCPRIHVMAGISTHPEAEAVMIENLRYATQLAPDMIFMIEPINTIDLPGYALSSLDQAQRVLAAVDASNVKIMFDCYHIGKMGGDVIALLHQHLDAIAHIQFASVPDRGTPDHGDVDYAEVFANIRKLGYRNPLGAEYKPLGKTEDSLDWLKTFFA